MLFTQIKQDQIQARKARDQVQASLLTTLIGELETAAKTTGKEIDDTAVVATVKKFIKNIEILLAAAPSEVATAERAILEKFLPKQLNEEELRAAMIALVDEKKQGALPVNVGTIMAALKAKFNGQYDGALASKLAKEVI